MFILGTRAGTRGTCIVSVLTYYTCHNINIARTTDGWSPHCHCLCSHTMMSGNWVGRSEWSGECGGVMQWVGRNSLRLCIYSLNNKTLTTSKISAREITQFNIPPLSHFMSKCFINVLIIRRHRKVILKL